MSLMLKTQMCRVWILALAAFLLPVHAPAADREQTPVNNVSVQVDAGGCRLADGVNLTVAELNAALAKRKMAGAQNIAILKIDPDCEYQMYFKVLKTTSDAGYVIALVEDDVPAKANTPGAIVDGKIMTAAGLALPDPLTTRSARRITTSVAWQKTGRPETLELFRTHVYGRAPVGRPDALTFNVVETDKGAMDGKATLKRVNVTFSGPGGKGVIRLALFIPNDAPKPVPGFLLICNRSPENIDPTRKKRSPFWPAERIVARGYAAAAFLNADVDPDKHDGFKNGVHGIFDPKETRRPPDAWGTIAAWAWGASRVMDYFETDEDIDARHIGVVGHSRGGKTALWCGAEDERFALVISNNSGCTGAALARRRKGESVARINKRFPHWFCANYDRYNNKENALPIDQHQLLALMAPRPVYVASASQDAWADPEGEFLSCVHAEPVYGLFGLKGVGTATHPKAQTPLQTGHIGYHMRAGKHNLVEYDWDCYMDFADKHWKQTP